MHEDYADDDLHYSEMSDDELSEIVNSRSGSYTQKVSDGAQKELHKRTVDNARSESQHQDTTSETPPPLSLDDVPGDKLYSVGQITLATFLGAPIAGCLLLSDNYRALGKGKTAWQSLVAGIAATILLFIISMFLPDNFPNTGLGIGSCIGMRLFVKQSQGDAIDTHLKAGGRKGSWALTIVLGLSCSVLLFGLIFLVVMALNLQ